MASRKQKRKQSSASSSDASREVSGGKQPASQAEQSKSRSKTIPRSILAVGAGLLLLLVGFSLVAADWYYALPSDTPLTYVGRNSCIECHQQQNQAWEGSDHDLAMDLATEETVLGTFDGAEIEHFGITSRMFRQDGKFMINTEGPDGLMQDFEIKYVFGVRPLQQYMVEIEPPTPGSAPGSIGRVQVLRVSWDTTKNQWFYLSPPDVNEKLSVDDPLHWTGRTQNWNHYCADCHSTDVHKNFDLATNTYHTTFSEIDVSCETCHGPGSAHVKLAKSHSLFWDRNLGYGLKTLKGDTKEAQINQVETCAACHSRREVICPTYQRGDNYYDQYSNELLAPHTYYCDGQIMEEDYVYGSFIQSKMFHKGIRCTDCHDPHTAKLKFEGNLLCTSCHQHPAGKYDTSAHHFHAIGSSGASCVECHMPETTYMEVDPRRDHSIRIPRPDLSVNLGTPNACTKCHLDKADLPREEHPEITRYDQWMTLARNGDEQVRAALAKVDQWALDAVDKWYGPTSKLPQEESFAYPLAHAWSNQPDAGEGLQKLVKNPNQPNIVRASAMMYLQNYLTEDSVKTALRYLTDESPQVRISAIDTLQEIRTLPRKLQGDVLDALMNRLTDKERAVRVQAAWALANQDPAALKLRGKSEAFQRALNERIEQLERDGDQPSSFLSLGVLYERLGDIAKAEQAYRTAIRIDPDFTGPRSNLVNLLEARQSQEERQMRQLAISGNRPAAEELAEVLQKRAGEIVRLQLEELSNIERDASLQPNFAPLQYQYGSALFLAGRKAHPELAAKLFNEAFNAYQKAKQLEPNSEQYAYMFALICQHLERWEQGEQAVEDLLKLNPNNPEFQTLQQQIKAKYSPNKEQQR
ncbi:ammonia-forming cytochrome c nitrite reductase subunit c552 [Bremerella cremea]|uniref:Ammonia-forming cytochrome c nitrite reductase subunit c552 n=1 Tax=Bremerella cremea TaxID=1031537 RepID=A0A368KUQ5_9BACT|nr:ammonia-forming cytochrome c nitrite reductase subunit c552 [Bremerella cremea]RCS54160.1 ammonia-forming cytochrome c nitrite reductase subunit c552 [Bremerella cremea]